MTPSNNIVLRDVQDSDLPIFFEYQSDPVATHMVAFAAEDPTDRDAFMAYWAKILSDPKKKIQTILLDGQVVGNVSSFEQFGKPSVGYWIGRAHWGKGIATSALTLFLLELETRPLYARAAKDNRGSIRVLEKCGFSICGEDTGFANARGAEIEEVIMELP